MALEDMQRLVIRDYRKAYPDVSLFDEEDLIQTIDDIYSEKDRQVVVVIDEWDAVFRERQDDKYEVSDIIPPDPNYKIQDMSGKELPAKHYSIYSPLSVVKAITTGYIRNYWNKTETYEALAEYIRKDYDGLKEAVTLLMDGGRLVVDTSTYQNDMTTFTCRDDVLSLLIHLGYLGYDDGKGEVFIPNKEILDEFKTSTRGTTLT